MAIEVSDICTHLYLATHIVVNMMLMNIYHMCPSASYDKIKLHPSWFPKVAYSEEMSRLHASEHSPWDSLLSCTCFTFHYHTNGQSCQFNLIPTSLYPYSPCDLLITYMHSELCMVILYTYVYSYFTSAMLPDFIQRLYY